MLFEGKIVYNNGINSIFNRKKLIPYKIYRKLKCFQMSWHDTLTLVRFVARLILNLMQEAVSDTTFILYITWSSNTHFFLALPCLLRTLEYNLNLLTVSWTLAHNYPRIYSIFFHGGHNFCLIFPTENFYSL